MPGAFSPAEPDPSVPARRPSYRTAALLAGLVLLGWAADLALGGRHTLGWLLALLLVAGIPALAAWSARRDAWSARRDAWPARRDAWSARRDAWSARRGAVQEQRPPLEPPSLDRAVRPARPTELAELIEVEIAADRLFPLAGYGTVPPPATEEELRAAEALLVSGDPPVGYARLEVVDGRAHLEGLSVRPRFMRQGRGSELVLAACDWAATKGFAEITLCTFAEVPWNGPFYAKLGFVELAELTPGLQALRDTERRVGLDAMGRRVVLIRQTAG
jgi:GNAT superfamily N-acetyltransferase